MDRQIKIGNRLSYDRQLKSSYALHLIKLKNLKAITNFSCPQ